MFKDNKLRLLMNLVGFIRLGEHHDPDASWIISSDLTSTQLQEGLDSIRKFEFDPPVYEDGKAPEDLLRSKASAARRSTRNVDFDDDSDGADQQSEDHGAYGPGGPTVRKSDEPRKKLTRRRRARTPVELDDEEKDRRAEARRLKELEKRAKEKSEIWVHDSDDEDWDAEKDAAFFAREEAIRAETLNAFKKSLALGAAKPATSRKRKATKSAEQSKRRKTPLERKTLFADSDDEEDQPMEDPESSGAASEENGVDNDNDDSEEETTDTPLSSQHAGAAIASDADTPRKSSIDVVTTKDATMEDAHEDEEEEDDIVPAQRRPAARNLKAGFVIESDSE